MNYLGKVKEMAAKATNYADKFLSEGGTTNTDHISQIDFLKQKVLKLQGTIRAMSQAEKELKHQLETMKIESQAIGAEYFKLSEELQLNQKNLEELNERLGVGTINHSNKKPHDQSILLKRVVNVINMEVGKIVESVLQKLDTYIGSYIGQDVEKIDQNIFRILSDEQVKMISDRISQGMDDTSLLNSIEQYKRVIKEKEEIVSNFEAIKQQNIQALLKDDTKLLEKAQTQSNLRLIDRISSYAGELSQLKGYLKLQNKQETNNRLEAKIKDIQLRLSLASQQYNIQVQSEQKVREEMKVAKNMLNNITELAQSRLQDEKQARKQLKDNEAICQELKARIVVYQQQSKKHRDQEQNISRERQTMRAQQQLIKQQKIGAQEQLQRAREKLQKMVQEIVKIKDANNSIQTDYKQRISNRDTQIYQMSELVKSKEDEQHLIRNELNKYMEIVQTLNSSLIEKELLANKLLLQLENQKSANQQAKEKVGVEGAGAESIPTQHLQKQQQSKDNKQQHALKIYMQQKNHAYQNQIASLRSLVSSLQDQKLELSQIIKENKEQKQSKIEEFAAPTDKHQDIIMALKEKIQTMEVEAQQLSKDIQNKQQQIKISEQKQQEYITKIKESQDESAFMKHQVQNLTNMVEKLTTDTASLQYLMVTSRQELQKSRQWIALNKIEMDELKAIKENLENQVVELNEKVHQQIQENNVIQEEYNRQRNEYNTLKQQYKRLFNQQISSESLATLKNEIDVLNKQKDSFEEQSKNILSANTQASAFQSSFKVLQQKFVNIFKIEFNVESFNAIKQREHTLQSTINDKSTQIGLLNSNLASFQHDLNKNKHQLLESQQLNKDSEQFRDQLILENQTIRQSHTKELDKVKQNYDEVIASLKLNITRLEQGNAKQQEQHKNKIVESKKQLHTKFTAILEAERVKLEQSHKEDVKKLKEKAANLEKDYGEMVDLKNKEVKDLYVSIENGYSDQIKHLTTSIKNLQDQLSVLTKHKQKLEQSASIQKISYVTDMSKLKESLEQEKAKLIKEQEIKIQSLKEKQKNKISTLKVTIAEQATKIQENNQELIKLRQNNKEISSQLNSQKENLDKFENLESHLNQLNRKLIVKDEEIKKLMMKNQQLTLSIQSLDDALESEQKYTEAKAQENQQFKNKIQQLKLQQQKAKKQKESKVTQNTKQYETLVEEYEDLKLKYNKVVTQKSQHSHQSHQIDTNVIKGFFLRYFDPETKYETRVQIIDTLCEVLKLTQKERDTFMTHKSRLERTNDQTQKKQQEETQSIQNKFFSFLTRQ